MIKANCTNENCQSLLFDCNDLETLGHREVTCSGCGRGYIVEQGTKPGVINLYRRNKSLKESLGKRVAVVEIYG